MKALVVLVASALTLAFAACSSSDDDACSCSVTANGDTKKMTCGQQACVGGSSFTCSENGSSPGGNACSTSASSSSSSSASSSSSGGKSSSSSTSGSPSNACDQLETFCATKCKSPPNSANLVKSCTDAVAEGNGTKCVAWQSTNSSLCKP